MALMQPRELARVSRLPTQSPLSTYPNSVEASQTIIFTVFGLHE